MHAHAHAPQPALLRLAHCHLLLRLAMRISCVHSRRSPAVLDWRGVDLALEELPPLDLFRLLEDVERLVQLRIRVDEAE